MSRIFLKNSKVNPNTETFYLHVRDGEVLTDKQVQPGDYLLKSSTDHDCGCWQYTAGKVTIVEDYKAELEDIDIDDINIKGVENIVGYTPMFSSGSVMKEYQEQELSKLGKFPTISIEMPQQANEISFDLYSLKNINEDVNLVDIYDCREGRMIHSLVSKMEESFDDPLLVGEYDDVSINLGSKFLVITKLDSGEKYLELWVIESFCVITKTVSVKRIGYEANKELCEELLGKHRVEKIEEILSYAMCE